MMFFKGANVFGRLMNFVLAGLVAAASLVTPMRHGTQAAQAPESGLAPDVTVIIPQAKNELSLDGVCGAEYSDAEVVTFFIAASGLTSTVYLKHTPFYLYACFTNLPRDASFAAVMVDVENDGNPLQSDDFLLRQFESGSSSSNRGSLSGFNGSSVQTGLLGWNSARSYLSEFTYGAEFRIYRGLMGGWQRTVGFSVGHVNGTSDSGTFESWPDTATLTAPTSWGDAYLFTGETVVPESGTAPLMDGRCDSPARPNEYNDAVTHSFATPAGTVTAYLKHTANDLWVCLGNLQTPDGGFRDEPNGVVRLNRVGPVGEGSPSSDDMFFGISYNGAVSARRGSGSGFNGPAPSNYFVMRYQRGDFYWDAEFRVGRTTAGGWDHDILLAVGEEQVGASGDYGWPNGYHFNVPNSWGIASLLTGEARLVDIKPAFGTTSLEVTQAIQDLENSVRLIAGKRTFVRVYPQMAAPGSPVNTTARLYGYRNGISLGPPLYPINPGGSINVFDLTFRDLDNAAFTFELPTNWIGAGSITLKAVMNPFRTTLETNYGNNEINAGPFSFETAKPLQVHLRDVQYTAADGTMVSIRDLDYDLLELQLRRMYPIARLYTTRRAIISRGYVEPQFFGPAVQREPLRDNIGGAVDYVNGLLVREREGMGAPAVGWQMYGLVDDAMGFMRGKSNGIPAHEAAGPTGAGVFCGTSGCHTLDTDDSYGDWYGGHEIGHTLGQHHADYCGAGSAALFEPDYPYEDGRIGGPASDFERYLGFDAGAAWIGIEWRALWGFFWFDIMSYCPNEWVSDYSYNGMYNHIQGDSWFPSTHTSALASEGIQAPEADLLHLYGTLDLDTDEASLLYVRRSSGAEVIPPLVSGPYHIRLFDAGDNLLADYAFTPETDIAGPERVGNFYQVVDFAAGTKRVAIYSEDSAAEIGGFAVSDNAPTMSGLSHDGGASLPASGTVTLNWTGEDADGDTLAYDVLYSFDTGKTWRLLASGVTEQSFEVDAAQLEGTNGANSAYFQVRASDGVLSGSAQAGPFSTAGNAPQATIVDPMDGSTYAYGQIVTLEGYGQDFEDGTLEDAKLSWSSDLDGSLGSGSLLSADLLSVGTHEITLQATDSHGQSASATVTVIVEAEFAETGPILNAAPEGITLMSSFGGGAPSAPDLHVVNDGTGSLSWTASSSAEWLTLGSTAGSAPAEVSLSVDASKLIVGVNRAQVTVSGAGQTVVVEVQVIVDGYAVRLPMVER